MSRVRLLKVSVLTLYQTECALRCFSRKMSNEAVNDFLVEESHFEADFSPAIKKLRERLQSGQVDQSLLQQSGIVQSGIVFA